MGFDLPHPPSQTGRTIVVTGANSSLGYWTTRRLAEQGATVVMACRNTGTAETTRADVLAAVPSARLEVMALDLGDLTSVRRFAEQFRARYAHLDVLINNAGVMLIPQASTVDGFEAHFGTNVLGLYLLTSCIAAKLLQLTAPNMAAWQVCAGGG